MEEGEKLIEGLAGNELHQHVGGLAGGASHGGLASAIESAIGGMGPAGLASSIMSGSGGHSSLISSLTSGGTGGPVAGILQQFEGQHGQNPKMHAAKALEHAAQHHPKELANALAHAQKGSGGGNEVLQALGNPMVRSIGRHLLSHL